MVFKRMRDIVVGSINEGLDKIENPVTLINQYLRDMDQEITKAKKAVINQQTIEKGFEHKWKDARNLASKRTGQARIAFEAGNEELAHKALSDSKHYEAKAAQYEELYQKAKEQVHELQEQLSTLEEKFQVLKDKKHSLIARAHAAKAKEHIHTSINRIDSESSFKEFQRLEERILEMEIKANMAGEPGYDSHVSSLTKLEYADEAEKELAKWREARQAKQTASTEEAR